MVTIEMSNGNSLVIEITQGDTIWITIIDENSITQSVVEMSKAQTRTLSAVLLVMAKQLD